MKNPINQMLVFTTFVFIQHIGLSQNDPCTVTNCCVNHSESANSNTNTNDGNRDTENCANYLSDASDAFHNRYKRITNYIPHPQSHMAIKTLRINMVIVGMNDQYPFIWENDDIHDDMTNLELLNFSFKDIIAYQNNWQTSNGFPCPEPINPAYLPDSKIRIEVVNVRYINSEYFAINNSDQKVKELLEYHLNAYPSDTNQLNWYLTKQYHGQGGGQVSFHSGVSVLNELKNLVVIRSGYGNLPYTGQNAMIHGHLPHELAHTLDLAHTYGNPHTLVGGGASDYIQFSGEHLDDVYSGESDWDVSIGGHSFTGCNNIMGGHIGRWTSPKQMGRMHRALTMPRLLGWAGANSVPEIRNYAYGYSEIPLVVSQNELWNFPMKSYNDIVVKKGATLTITCRLEMVPQAKIVVEQGGTLIVDGGTITAARCGGPDKEGLWQGIEVWGSSNFSQTSLDANGFLRQGSVYLINGALIEHAVTGVRADRIGHINYGGGIIHVENANIRNCDVGLSFSNYVAFANEGLIKKSIFEIDENWKLTTNPSFFVRGSNVRNIDVEENVFVNNNPNVKIIGIRLVDAHMRIIGIKHHSISICDADHAEWLGNQFINLYKGIDCRWIGTANSILAKMIVPVIMRNKFQNCTYGIVNSGMPNIKIEANNFKLGGIPENNSHIIGIWQIGGVNYSIAENCITQLRHPMDTRQIIGIAVANTGGDDHVVYKNQTHNVQYGYLAMDRNRTPSTNPNLAAGLQFICNENHGSQFFDFAVTSQFPNDPMVGIRGVQNGFIAINNVTLSSGTPARDAGNIFSQNCQVDSDFQNEVINPIVYFHTTATPKIPQCYSSNVSLVEYEGSPSLCKSKFGGIVTDTPLPDDDEHGLGRPTNEILSDFAIANSQFLATAILYNSVINNGNTQSLLEYIYPNANMTATDIRLALLNVSPNIGRDIIESLIKENTILTNQDLLQVIAANPDVCHDEEMLLMLKEKANPMDSWMIDFLRNMGTFTTDRTSLEWMFGNQIAMRQQLAWEMIDALMVCDTATSNDIYAWLDVIGTPRATYLKVEDMASVGNFSNAMSVLNNMNTSNLSRWEQTEHQGMITWIEMKQTLQNSQRTILDLDSIELEPFRAIAADYVRYGIVGIYAMNLLNLYEPDQYDYEIVLPTTNRAQMSEKRTLKPFTIRKEWSINAFPNPADQEITFEFDEKIDEGTIAIYDAKGVLVHSIQLQNTIFFKLNISDFVNGNFIVVLSNSDNHKLAETKIIIQHK